MNNTFPVLYDIYVMCQEHAYQDFKMFVQNRMQPCEPDMIRHSVCEGCDVYVLEWRNFKGWDISPSYAAHEANVLREWIYGYVNMNRRPLDGDGMDFVCICEGESVVEHARNCVSSLPLDFYAHMVIHLPEDLGGWELL